MRGTDNRPMHLIIAFASVLSAAGRQAQQTLSLPISRASSPGSRRRRPTHGDEYSLTPPHEREHARALGSKGPTAPCPGPRTARGARHRHRRPRLGPHHAGALERRRERDQPGRSGAARARRRRIACAARGAASAVRREGFCCSPARRSRGMRRSESLAGLRSASLDASSAAHRSLAAPLEKRAACGGCRTRCRCCSHAPCERGARGARPAAGQFVLAQRLRRRQPRACRSAGRRALRAPALGDDGPPGSGLAGARRRAARRALRGLRRGEPSPLDAVRRAPRAALRAPAPRPWLPGLRACWPRRRRSRAGGAVISIRRARDVPPRTELGARAGRRASAAGAAVRGARRARQGRTRRRPRAPAAARRCAARTRRPCCWPTRSRAARARASSPTTTATAPPPAPSRCAACACSAPRRHVDYLVPDRVRPRLRPDAGDRRLRASARGADLLITVDNGIASVEGVRQAQRARPRGARHRPPPAGVAAGAVVLPTADVIVNPNQPGCGFESKSIAGVGVMFYVLLALRAELRARGASTPPTQPRLDALLDLVALGTVADVVKLDANNRRLVAQGLKRIRAGRMRPGWPRCSRPPAATPRRASGFRLRLRARAAHQRRRPAGRHDARHRMPADRRRRRAPTSSRARSTRINRERRDIEGGMREQAEARVAASLFDGRRAPPAPSACSTPTSTKAWSASSPRASRTVAPADLRLRASGAGRR